MICIFSSGGLGVPVIAYASGGIPHQIQHGRTGFLVQTGDVEGAAKRLVELVTDEGLRKRMGKTAVECVGEEYFTVRFYGFFFPFPPLHHPKNPIPTINFLGFQQQ